MPDLLQKHPASAAGRSVDPRVLPAALAWVAADGGAGWNERAAAVLRAHLGPAEPVWRRWLAAAAARLAAGGRRSDLVTVPGPQPRRLEIRRAEAPDDRGRLWLDLRPLPHTAGDRDLAWTVGTLSHELRTPLTSMKSSLKLILAGETGPLAPGQERFLGMTLRSVDRLERLVDDLLDATRADAGRLTLRSRSVDLVPLLQEVAALHGAAARQAGQQLVTDLPAGLTVETDPDQVVQMLNNLLGNALKYAGRGARVVLRLEPAPALPAGTAAALAALCGLRPACFGLTVRDDGPGLEESVRGHGFQPFRRGAEAASGRIPGAGLGLHITRSLAAAHGGSVTLESPADGGTTARILLPATAAARDCLLAAARLERGRDQAPAGSRLALVDPADPAVGAVEVRPGCWAAWVAPGRPTPNLDQVPAALGRNGDLEPDGPAAAGL